MGNIQCTCTPDNAGHLITCALVINTQLEEAKRTVKHLKRTLKDTLNKTREVIYEIPAKPIALGNFFHDVKENMEKQGICGPYIEFAYINGVLCVVEPEWEDDE